MNWLKELKDFWTWLEDKYEEALIPSVSSKATSTSPVVTETNQIPMPEEITPVVPNIDTLLPWDTVNPLSHSNYHNVRVICDFEGLTFDQKEILTACVWRESDFMTNPRPNQNKDKTGAVWSTDWGIVQVNDYFNIGEGKPFSTVQYVLDNPETCVRWMANIYKTTGSLQPWASFTTDAYKQFLGKTL